MGMCIVTLLEQLASTTHHKVNLVELLKEEHTTIQQAFSSNDSSVLKTFFNGNNLLADRNTIFEL